MRYGIKMRLFLYLLVLCLPRLALAAANPVFVGPSGDVQLLTIAPAPAGQAKLALVFSLQPGWHIYWKNPGDAGYPPSVSAAPPVTLSPLTFPPPQTLIQDGLKSYVLTGHVELPFTATHVVGKDVHITAHWLACAAQCVPEQAAFTLPVGEAVAADRSSGTALPLWLLALLGGLILNLMPCVFPVLAMKAVSFVRLGGAAHGHIRREALGYGAGVMLSMAILGGLLLGLRAAGQTVFWGFQFHAPVFVAIMAWILLAVGLSFAGLFHIQAPAIIRYLPAQNSFLTGLLAVLVAAPCTAPFMGTAIAAALSMPFLPALSLFLALGFGMALPILVLGFAPHLAAWLPRPGRWMVWVQRVLSLPLFASFIWLGWVLFQQSGLPGVGLLLLGAVILVAALSRRPLWALAVLVLLPFLRLTPAPPNPTLPGAQPYSAQTLAALRARGQPVFIDLTASWCITCQFNERMTLVSKPVQSLFQTQHVAVLVGDWTNRNPALTALLRRYNHAGVPLYLYYPPYGPARILPQLLTPTIMETEIRDKH